MASRYKLNKLPLNIAFKLFDTIIMPILLYGSEVWEAYEYSPTKSLMNGEAYNRNQGG